MSAYTTRIDALHLAYIGARSTYIKPSMTDVLYKDRDSFTTWLQLHNITGT